MHTTRVHGPYRPAVFTGNVNRRTRGHGPRTRVSKMTPVLDAHVFAARDQIPLHYPACDQLASRSATSSQTGRRPASEQDRVTEYGLNRSATRFELSRHVGIAGTCLRQVGYQVCDLDSVMEFSQSRSQTSSRTSSRASSQARYSAVEFGLH